MSALPSIPSRYLGDGQFEAIGPRFKRIADGAYVIGERYELSPTYQRSMKSHDHQFAEIGEIWKNLPDHLMDEFPSAESLRKHALIRCGYADVTHIVAGSHEDAMKIAAYAQLKDRYAIVTVDKRRVTILEAQSQSVRAMGGKKFQESKTAVLVFLSAMIGTSPAEVERAVA